MSPTLEFKLLKKLKGKKIKKVLQVLEVADLYLKQRKGK